MTPRLTERQYIIINQLSNGEAMKRIADRLNISRQTMDRDLMLARQNLGAKTTYQLIAACVRHGLIA